MRDLIKLGNHYRTREGESVRVLTTTLRAGRYTVVALIDFGDHEEPQVFTKTGCFDVDERRHPYDLERV
jgi:hypothetical protein